MRAGKLWGLSCAFVTILLAAVSSPLRAATVTYDFNDGTFGGLIVTAPPGYSAVASGGVVNVTKDAGAGNGSVYLAAPFTLTGDFVATVVAHRDDLAANGEMGIIGLPALGDVFFYGNDVIQGNVFSPSVDGSSRLDSAATVTFKFQRTGNTLTSYYDEGGGFQTLFSKTDPSLAAPSTLRLFFQQAYGSTAAQSGYFDNFTITSDSISAVPLPGTAAGGLVLLGGLGLTKLRRRRTAEPAA